MVRKAGHLSYSLPHSQDVLITAPPGSLGRLLSPVFPGDGDVEQRDWSGWFCFFDHISPYVVLHTSIRRCVTSDLFDSRCVISGVTGLGDHHLDPFILQG